MPLLEAEHLARRGYVVRTADTELIERPREIHQFRIGRKRIQAEPVLQFLSAGIEDASLFRQTLHFAFEGLSFHLAVPRALQGRKEISGFVLQGAQSRPHGGNIPIFRLFKAQFLECSPCGVSCGSGSSSIAQDQHPQRDRDARGRELDQRWVYQHGQSDACRKHDDGRHEPGPPGADPDGGTVGLGHAQPGTQSVCRAPERLDIPPVVHRCIDTPQQTQSFLDGAEPRNMCLARAQELEQFSVLGQRQCNLVDIPPAHCVHRRGKLAPAHAVLACCRRKRHFDTFQLVRIFAPGREVGLFQRVGESGLASRLAGFIQLSLEGTSLFGQPVRLSLLPLDLLDLLAGQVRQGARQGPDPLHDAGKFFPAARESDGTLDKSEPVGGGFRVVELRLQLLELVRAPHEIGVSSHRLLDILRRLVEIVPFAAAALGGNTGEQVRGDPVQVESAGHLPLDFGGDVGCALPGRIDQVPEIQKETTRVVGGGQTRRNVAFVASLPARTRSFALAPPGFSVQFEFAGYRR